MLQPMSLEPLSIDAKHKATWTRSKDLTNLRSLDLVHVCMRLCGLSTGTRALSRSVFLLLHQSARSGPDDVLAIIERSVAPWSVSWSVSWSVPLSVECLGVCLRAVSELSQSCRRAVAECLRVVDSAIRPRKFNILTTYIDLLHDALAGTEEGSMAGQHSSICCRLSWHIYIAFTSSKDSGSNRSPAFLSFKISSPSTAKNLANSVYPH